MPVLWCKRWPQMWERQTLIMRGLCWGLLIRRMLRHWCHSFSRVSDTTSNRKREGEMKEQNLKREKDEEREKDKGKEKRGRGRGRRKESMWSTVREGKACWGCVRVAAVVCERQRKKWEICVENENEKIIEFILHQIIFLKRILFSLKFSFPKISFQRKLPPPSTQSRHTQHLCFGASDGLRCEEDQHWRWEGPVYSC